MKVVIDCGAYKGRSLQKLKEIYSPDICYAFEPITEYYYATKQRNPDSTVLQKAAWITQRKKKLYIGNGEGSSLYGSKRTDNIQRDKYETVECIDFAKWIIDTFDKDDCIILKMDIEGAEYKVLNKMITTGAIEYIDILRCEWHHRKIKAIERNTHKKVMNKLKTYNITLLGWKHWRSN